MNILCITLLLPNRWGKGSNTSLAIGKKVIQGWVGGTPFTGKSLKVVLNHIYNITTSAQRPPSTASSWPTLKEPFRNIAKLCHCQTVCLFIRYQHWKQEHGVSDQIMISVSLNHLCCTSKRVPLFLWGARMIGQNESAHLKISKNNKKVPT